MGEIVVITSGKGGVGKTTAAASIGAAVAASGKKVLIIDMDLGLRKLDIALGIADRVVYNVVDVIKERCSLSDALIHDGRFGELYILAASQSENKLSISPDEMKMLCDKLADEFDYVFIDSPAGVERGFENSVAGASSAIIVVIPEPASVRDADRIADILTEQYHMRNIKVLINRYNANLVSQGAMLSADEVINMIRVGIIGIIPEDESVISSVVKGFPVVSDDKSRASRCFLNTARRLLGADVPLSCFKKDSIIKRLISVLTDK